MNLFVVLVFAAVAPPYQPTAAPLDALPDAKPAVHVDQPITKPAMVPHGANWGLGDRCPMCVGGHLFSYHGLTQRQLDAIGEWNWSRHHQQLHAAAVARVPGTRPATVQSNQNPAGQSAARAGCPGGVCQPVRSLLRGRWR